MTVCYSSTVTGLYHFGVKVYMDTRIRVGKLPTRVCFSAHIMVGAMGYFYSKRWENITSPWDGHNAGGFCVYGWEGYLGTDGWIWMDEVILMI